MSKLSRKLGDITKSAKQNRPHLTFGAGVIGVTVAAVWACKSTLRLEETMDEIDAELEVFHEQEDVTTPETIYAYSRAAMKITKLYAPSVVLGAASIGLLVDSHVSLTKRNAALTAAYTSLSLAFEEYRERIREEIGEERERELFEHVVEEDILNEDGEKIGSLKRTPASEHSRFFDEFSPEYQRNNEHNRLFLTCQQNYFNDLLQARGHVFLNEVYDNLGLDRSAAGQIVGWRFEPGSDSHGANYIDFGIENAYNRDFVNGPEQSILLHFNVDTQPIVDSLTTKKG